MSRKPSIFAILLIVFLKLQISYGFTIKDILDESRKPFYFTQKEYKGMLEREAKEDVIKIPNLHTFKHNNTPNNYFKFYLNDSERKKSINNSIRLLCNSANPMTQFDYFSLIEQTLELDDKEIIKATMFRFRELYLIWLASKSLEKIFHSKEVNITKMCDYMNNPQPNLFFSDNDIQAEFINIRDLEDSDFYQNIDVLEEDRYTSAYGFRLEIKVKDIIKGSNEIYNSLTNDPNFSLGSLIQIDFINAHTNFNNYFSSLDYIIRVNIKGLGSGAGNKSKNNEVNIKSIYSEMKLGHLLLLTMEKISFSQFKNSFSAMFKVSFNLDSIFHTLSTDAAVQNNEKDQSTSLGLGIFSKNKIKKEGNNQKRRIYLLDLALSFQDIFNQGSSNLISTLKKSVERAFKLYLGIDVISEMKKDRDIQKYINIFSDSYRLEKENMDCDEKELLKEINISSLYENDILNIHQTIFKLCSYRKAIEQLGKNIKNKENDSIYMSINDLLTEDYEFSKFLILSNYASNNKYFNLIEKILPTYYHNNFYDKKGCVDISNEETLLLFTALSYKIAKNTSHYYSLFEVYTSNYNNYLDNAKLYLNYYLISISKEIRTMNFYLNKCKNSKSQTLLDQAFDRHENNNPHKELLKEKLLMLEDRMNNFYNLLNLIDNTLGYAKIDFAEQLTKIRSFFYQFVYKNEVLLGNEVNFSAYKNVFTDFSKNRDFNFFMEDILTAVIRLVVDKSSFEDKSIKFLTLRKYFQEEKPREYVDEKSEENQETVKVDLDSLNNRKNVKKEMKDGKHFESFEINLNDIMKNEDI